MPSPYFTCFNVRRHIEPSTLKPATCKRKKTLTIFQKVCKITSCSWLGELPICIALELSNSVGHNPEVSMPGNSRSRHLSSSSAANDTEASKCQPILKVWDFSWCHWTCITVLFWTQNHISYGKRVILKYLSLNSNEFYNLKGRCI